MSAADIEYISDYREFPTKESALDWLDNYLSLDERNNLIRALQQEPCDDAINREDALMCLTGEIKDTDTIETIIARFAKRIKKLPPVIPTRPGYWIFDDECKEHGHCSRCGYGSVDLVNGEPHKFCRNCGTKMVAMVEPQERGCEE